VLEWLEAVKFAESAVLLAVSHSLMIGDWSLTDVHMSLEQLSYVDGVWWHRGLMRMNLRTRWRGLLDALCCLLLCVGWLQY
jgi:hypothetical protein